MSSERRPSFLAEHVDRLAGTHLRELLKDAARGKRLRHRLGPILLDLSRQKLDLAALDALGAHVEASGWQAARDAMFSGQPINTSEDRAVLHTALRAEEGSGIISVNGSAAHRAQPGDLVIIAAFCQLSEAELEQFQPTLVYVDANNAISHTNRSIPKQMAAA